MIDGVYYNPSGIQTASNYFLPSEGADSHAASAGHVRVPSHLLLAAGFEMTLASAPVAPWPEVCPNTNKKRRTKHTTRHSLWAAVQKGARVLSAETRAILLEEVDARRYDA
eukprot:100502-Pleurochrysis_carterae.AAC.1